MSIYKDGKSFHMTIGVDTILNWTNKELVKYEGIIQQDDGTPLSAIQIYNLAAKAKREGFTVIPMCDNCDKEGYCQGHGTKEKEDEK